MSRFAVWLTRDVIRVLIVASGVFVFLRLLLSSACEALCVLHRSRVSKPIGRSAQGPLRPECRRWQISSRGESMRTHHRSHCVIGLERKVLAVQCHDARKRPSLPAPSPSPGERSAPALFNAGDRGHGSWKWPEGGGSAGRVCRIGSPTRVPQSHLHALKLSRCFLKK